MEGMLKTAHDEYKKIPLEMFQCSLESWPDRVMAIHKAQGHHAPNYKKKK